MKESRVLTLANKVYINNIYQIRREKNMKMAKIFRNGRSQAVRLPKEFRFDEDIVYVKKSGNAVVLLPCKNSWASLVDSLNKFSDDFMTERRQLIDQSREPLD